MATAPIVAVANPDTTHSTNRLQTLWRLFGTPALVVLMAIAIALTITRNWNALEGGRIEQVTNDAYVRRDLTPLSTKVVGLVREVKVNDYQHVRAGDELVILADDDYRAQVAQATAAVDARVRRGRARRAGAGAVHVGQHVGSEGRGHHPPDDRRARSPARPRSRRRPRAAAGNAVAAASTTTHSRPWPD